MAKLVLFDPERGLTDVLLDKPRLTFGRRADNDICLPFPAVSGEHAAIVTILDDSFLEDLGSTNGTLVNGKPVTKHFLRDGDLIDIGRQRLVYLTDEHWTPDAIGGTAPAWLAALREREPPPVNGARDAGAAPTGRRPSPEGTVVPWGVATSVIPEEPGMRVDSSVATAPGVPVGLARGEAHAADTAAAGTRPRDGDRSETSGPQAAGNLAAGSDSASAAEAASPQIGGDPDAPRSSGSARAPVASAAALLAQVPSESAFVTARPEGREASGKGEVVSSATARSNGVSDSRAFPPAPAMPSPVPSPVPHDPARPDLTLPDRLLSGILPPVATDVPTEPRWSARSAAVGDGRAAGRDASGLHDVASGANGSLRTDRRHPSPGRALPPEGGAATGPSADATAIDSVARLNPRAIAREVAAVEVPTLRVLSGPSAGRSLPLAKPVTTVGRAGVQVVLVRRRGESFVVVPSEGAAPAELNGVPLGAEGRVFQPGDVLVVAGARITLIQP